MTNRSRLMTLAMTEGLVMFSAIVRIAFPGQLDLSITGHVIWLAATVFIASASIAHFVVRNARLNAQGEQGPSVEEDRKQIFVVSLAILAAAGLLSLTGPRAIAGLLG